jgi:hypothetical protein
VREPRGGQTVDIGRGKVAEFVRWVPSAEAWAPQTISGTFVRLSGNGWIVLVDGAEVYLDRETWDWCAE